MFENDRDSDALDRAVSDLVRALSVARIQVVRSTTTESLVEHERTLGRPFPPSIRHLYTKFGGVDMDHAPIDAGFIRLWPVSETYVSRDAEVGPFGPGLAFADFLISSIVFAVLFDSGRVVTLDGKEARIVADDLAQFIEKCLAQDPTRFG